MVAACLTPLGLLVHWSLSARGPGPLGNNREASIPPEDYPRAADFLLQVELPQVDDLQHLHQVHKCPRNLNKGKVTPHAGQSWAVPVSHQGPGPAPSADVRSVAPHLIWPVPLPSSQPPPSPPCPINTYVFRCWDPPDSMVRAGLRGKGAWQGGLSRQPSCLQAI